MRSPLNEKIPSLVICGSAIHYFNLNPKAKLFIPNIHNTLLSRQGLFSGFSNCQNAWFKTFNFADISSTDVSTTNCFQGDAQHIFGLNPNAKCFFPYVFSLRADFSLSGNEISMHDGKSCLSFNVHANTFISHPINKQGKKQNDNLTMTSCSSYGLHQLILIFMAFNLFLSIFVLIYQPLAPHPPLKSILNPCAECFIPNSVIIWHAHLAVRSSKIIAEPEKWSTTCLNPKANIFVPIIAMSESLEEQSLLDVSLENLFDVTPCVLDYSTPDVSSDFDG